MEITATCHSSARSDIMELNLNVSSNVTVGEIGDYINGVKQQGGGFTWKQGVPP
jgi:hypothetical protein